MIRLVFGLLGLLIVLAIVGKLAGRFAQSLGARPVPVPASAASASAPARQLPQHYQQALEEAMRQGRAHLPDEAR